jgi:hypothetical protein
MCPVDQLASLQLGPNALDVAGLTALLLLYALRVAEQAWRAVPAEIGLGIGFPPRR